MRSFVSWHILSFVLVVLIVAIVTAASVSVVEFYLQVPCPFDDLPAQQKLLFSLCDAIFLPHSFFGDGLWFYILSPLVVIAQAVVIHQCITRLFRKSVDGPKGKRLVCRFTIRDLLVVLALLCVCAGVYTARRGWRERCRAYEARLYEMGLSVGPRESVSHAGGARSLTIHSYCNTLPSFPREVESMTNVRKLSIDCAHTTSLPSEIGIFRKLTYLNLRDNELTSLPPELGLLTKLEELVVAGNEFQTLPLEICRLKRLKLLDLRDNPLRGLPPEIGELEKLESLGLGQTFIKDADLEHLKCLQELRYLDVSHTMVTGQGVADLRAALPNCEIQSD
jgi:hypothetical protein